MFALVSIPKGFVPAPIMMPMSMSLHDNLRFGDVFLLILDERLIPILCRFFSFALVEDKPTFASFHPLVVLLHLVYGSIVVGGWLINKLPNTPQAF